LRPPADARTARPSPTGIDWSVRGTIMDVILREHVEHLGERGEIVKVADGYARNYLLPRKLALLVTDGNRQQIERERVKFEAREAEEQKIAQAIADRIASVELVIARKVGETDALYGSVTASDVAEALAAKGFDIDRRKLQLAEPIKRLGEIDVPVKLHRGVTATVKVKVVAEGAAD
jgi:large subunit ribosomal protein L9